VSRPENFAAIASAVSTATMSRPSTATEPRGITRRFASTVITIPFLTTSDTVRRCAGRLPASDAARRLSTRNVRNMEPEFYTGHSAIRMSH